MDDKIDNIRLLESEIDEIEIIYHISDIHIRKKMRHDEYLIVFRRFAKIVEDHIAKHGKNCSIVVTGDIMHDKTEMTPESVDMLRKFLLIISDLTEVIMIIGNHDVNIFNKGSLDCLTPLVSDLFTKHKIHLLTENNVYVYGSHNLLFGVTTLWAKKVTIVNDKTIETAKLLCKKSKINLSSNPTKIALYHGMIHGSKMDNGSFVHKTNTSCFNMTDFASYDIVMLGDIHKHQFLNKNKTIAYAGSLIQQKRDEDLLEHGTIQWDIFKKRAKFIKIKNDFGMIQIVVGSTEKHQSELKKKLTQNYENKDLPKDLDIKMIYSSIEGKDTFKKMYESITKTHNVIKLTEMTDTSSVDKISTESYLRSISSSFREMNSSNNSGTNLDTNLDTDTSTNSINKTNSTNNINSTNSTNNTNSTNRNLDNDENSQKANPIKITDNDAVLKIMMDHLDQGKNKNESKKANRTNKTIKTVKTVKNANNDYDENDHDDNDHDLTNAAIRSEIADILNEINYNYEQDIKNIRLKSVQFDNMFIYIENNIIDFEKFEHIVGLNASNYQGKSSFIDVILYSIYGECSRGKRYDVLNIKKKKMCSRVVIDVNSNEYIIVRSSQINSTSKRDLKENVSLFENGVEITADDRVKTHQLIAKKICSYDDMINNSFVLQKNGKTFVDLPDRAKKDLLCKMARLDIFDNIFVEAKSRYSSLGQAMGRLIKKVDQYDEMIKKVEKTKKTKSIKSISSKSISSKSTKSVVKKTKYKNKVIEVNETNNSKNETNNSKNENIVKNLVSGRLVLIENEFRNRINEKNLEIRKLDESNNLAEKKLERAIDKSHSMNIKISNHKSNKIILKNFENDKMILNKLNKEFLTIANKLCELYEARKNAKTDVRFRTLKTLNDLEREKQYLIERNNTVINKIDEDIETKLRELVHVKPDLNVSDTKTKKILELEKHRAIEENLMENLKSISDAKNDFPEVEKKYSVYVSLKNERNTIDNKIKILNEELKKNQDQFINLKNHKYNPECAQCMENPVTNMLIKCRETIEAINNDLKTARCALKTVEDKIKTFDLRDKNIEVVFNDLNNMIKTEQSVKDKYDNAIQQCKTIEKTIEKISESIDQIEQNTIIENEIKQLKNERNNHVRETNKNIIEYDGMITQINDIEQLCEKSRDICDRINVITTNLRECSTIYSDCVINSIEEQGMIRCYDVLNNEIKNIKEQIIGHKKKLMILNNDKTKLETDMERFLEIRDEINKTDKKKLIIGYIKKILDKNGLVDVLLSKSIIPYLQRNINGILSDVGHYQVNIEYKNQSINVYKDSGLNVIMSSGYESYLLDLVFRLALVQINNHIKTDFILIDEGFNACDSDNKNNVKELLEHMKLFYTWVLIISHDDFIKSFYDMDIRIQSIDNGSRLSNTKIIKNIMDFDQKQ
jgi:DNA repair exonuclease SbcCD ATPase subunit